MTLLKLISITFILIMGLKIAMSEGMLLGKLGSYFERKVEEGSDVFNLFICPWCMATLGSLVAHAFAFGLGVLPFEWNWQLLVRWPLVLMGSSFLAGNAWNVYEMINRIREKNEIESYYYKTFLEKDPEHSAN